jgi:hypothetical protein
MLLVLYVDDIVIAGSDLDEVERVKADFKRRFEMKDLGELRHYLGMTIERNGREYIKVHQADYASTLVKRYRRYLKAGTRHRATVPMTRDLKLTREEKRTAKQQEYVDAFPYQELLGSLLYLAVNTRPDIAFAVNACARFSNSPTYATCRTLVRILDYVSNTCTVGIVYRGADFDIHGFCDSDWAGDIDTRRSTTGYLTFMAGGPIAWQSRLQTTVATSSMEAEYMAAYALIQEICWLRGVLSELGFNTDEPTKVYMDSKSAIDLANNPVHHKRSKHIAIKYHWIRQMVNRHLVQLIHVSSEMQLADMLTKALTEIIFNELTNRVLN